MRFTPKEMDQIVNKNGPAWDKLQEEERTKGQRNFQSYLEDVLHKAERECKATGSTDFKIISICHIDNGYKEMYQDIFNHLKNIGFKLNKVEIYQVYDFAIEAKFYFGEPEKPKNTWKERFSNWMNRRTVYYGK